MTLPVKNSRTIRVDSKVYRWTASPMRGQEPPMTAFICHADTKPSDSLLEIQMWQAHCDIVTPQVAENLIRGARNRGWDPAAKGKFVIDATESMNFLGA